MEGTSTGCIFRDSSNRAKYIEWNDMFKTTPDVSPRFFSSSPKMFFELVFIIIFCLFPRLLLLLLPPGLLLCYLFLVITSGTDQVPCGKLALMIKKEKEKENTRTGKGWINISKRKERDCARQYPGQVAKLDGFPSSFFSLYLCVLSIFIKEGFEINLKISRGKKTFNLLPFVQLDSDNNNRGESVCLFLFK